MRLALRMKVEEYEKLDKGEIEMGEMMGPPSENASPDKMDEESVEVEGDVDRDKYIGEGS